ncbi:MAG: hypothetical protein IIA30_10980, partial [Myxococcales bacterium]|nr:hypothetical protein [Myxococcales bacterium]
PYQRRLFCRRVLEEGGSVAEPSEAAGWSERTGFKWLQRLREEPDAGLEDRRSGPRRARTRSATRGGRSGRWCLLLHRAESPSSRPVVPASPLRAQTSPASRAASPSAGTDDRFPCPDPAAEARCRGRSGHRA